MGLLLHPIVAKKEHASFDCSGRNHQPVMNRKPYKRTSQAVAWNIHISFG
jgi:hypothetical protein